MMRKSDYLLILTMEKSQLSSQILYEADDYGPTDIKGSKWTRTTILPSPVGLSALTIFELMDPSQGKTQTKKSQKDPFKTTEEMNKHAGKRNVDFNFFTLSG